MNTATEAKIASPELSLAQQRTVALQEELRRFIAIVAEQMEPERIILFGSLALGQVHEWSDLDLVVIADTNLPFFERLRCITEWVLPSVGMDVLVYTPAEWAHLVVNRRFVRDEIAAKGKVVYERGR
jgi:predicted nucleotidyltransferase